MPKNLLVVLTLVLTGCTLSDTHRICETSVGNNEHFYVVVSNGDYQGRYYCEDIDPEKGLNCTAIEKDWVDKDLDCPDLRTEFYNAVIFGGGTAEYRWLRRK